jgi:ribosomal protein S18 acetylase RimI-like enzyme
MGLESGPIECRLLDSAGIDRGMVLLDEVKVTFGGYSSPRLNQILCQEAARARGLAMLVADCGGVPAGFVLVMIDPLVFQRAFLMRHPLVAVRMALQRFSLRMAKPIGRATTAAPAAGGGSYDFSPRAASSWKESGAEVARIVHIGVARRFRGRKVATSLYYYLFQQMASRRVAKILARVDADNLPSIALHRQTGWELRNFGTFFEAVKYLGVPGQSRTGPTTAPT